MTARRPMGQLGLRPLGLDGLGGPVEDTQTVPAFGLNFAANDYQQNGAPVASPLTLTRAGIAWRTAADGVTVAAFGADTPRRDSRGLYLERARGRLNTYSTDQVNWSIVSSATRVADAAIGLLTPVIIGSGGSTASVLSSNTNISLVAGQKRKVIAVYKAPSSGRARFRVSNTAALTSTVSGPVGAMAIVDEAAGTWSDVRNTDLGGGWYMFEAIFTAGTTEAGYRLREGPDSAVAGQTAIVAWSQISDLDGDIILGTQSAPATTAEDFASVDLSAFPATGMATKFTLGHVATDANLLQMESAAGTSNVRLNIAATTGEMTATARILGADVATVSAGTINSRQEYTVGVECRSGGLSIYVNGGLRGLVEVPGAVPALTLARLFSAGGSCVTMPVVNFYDKAI